MIRAISTIMAGFVLALSAVGCGAAGGEENVGDDSRTSDGKAAPVTTPKLTPETAVLGTSTGSSGSTGSNQSPAQSDGSFCTGCTLNHESSELCCKLVPVNVGGKTVLVPQCEEMLCINLSRAR
jgi:hypothetical protein